MKAAQRIAAALLDHRRVPWLAAIAVLLVLHALSPRALERADLLLHDLLVMQGVSADAPASAVSAPLVIAIDEASLKALGAWPWPRSRHADLIDTLNRGGVAGIGYPVMFAEPSSDPREDGRLAEAIARAGNVVLPVAPVARPGGGIDTLQPLPALAAAAARLGHVDVELDADALARRLFLEAGEHRPQWPAFAWALMDVSQPPRPLAGLGRQHDAGAATAGRWVRDHEVMVLPSSHDWPLRHIPAVDLLTGRVPPETLRGRTVLVGVTAAGLGAPLATPMSGHGAPMTSVDFHARAYMALNDGAVVTPLSPRWSLLAGLLLLGAVTWVGPKRRMRDVALVAVAVLLPWLGTFALLDGLSRWLGTSGVAIAVTLGALGWLATQSLRLGLRLNRANARADATLQAISDAVFRLDMQLNVRYLNRQALVLVGSTIDQVQGRAFGELVVLGRDLLIETTALAERCRDTARSVTRPGHVSMPAGREGPARALRLSASPLFDASGRIEGVVLVLNDVSDTVDAAERLAHQATHDALTGLPNRLLLRDRLRQVLAQRDAGVVAVMFVDLDRFKRINDSLGHQQGDAVLTTLASRLRAVCRASDTVARWGGDEFMIILQGLGDREAVSRVAAKVMHAVGQTITLDGVDFRFSCSIGVAIAHEDSSDPDVLFAMADTAMYRSKSQAGAAIHFYAHDMSAGTRDWIELESDLRRGLEQNRFEVHYQPQYELATGRLSALEALLRFRREGGAGGAPGELLQPVDFIAVAEESGLIEEIGDWVLQAVTRQIAEWSRQGLNVVPVAVNVSARQCLGRSLVRRVSDALNRSGIEPSLLRLELTETTAMSDVDHVAALLADIHALGVSLSVDDFGTGYSSLSYLKRFPIDELKVDRSFVRDLVRDADDEAIVRATIALAHGLGMRVVAEGVENDEQLSRLSAQGCDVVQGYLFSRPLSSADLLANNILGSKQRSEPRALRLIKS